MMGASQQPRSPFLFPSGRGVRGRSLPRPVDDNGLVSVPAEIKSMSRTPQNPDLPRWLLLVGSGAIAFHFFALLMMVLAARSGPWPSPFGPSQQEPPRFAWSINDTSRYYLQPLQM